MIQKKEGEGKKDERRRYNVKGIPRDFMHNQEWQAAVMDLINIMEQNIAGQTEIDDVYTKYINCLKAEMDKFLPNTNKKIRRKFKHYKPFCDMDLIEQWKKKHTAFVKFSKSNKRNRSIRTRLKSIYRMFQCKFDKMLRRKEHAFNKSQIDKLEQINTDNPTQFWNYIKKCRPRKDADIPFTVRAEDGMITSEESIVLKTWEIEISNIFNRSDEVLNKFDTAFFNDKKLQKELMEDLTNPNEDVELNERIMMHEVEKAAQKLKLWKAVRPDEIPNEVLKLPGV